MSNNNIKMTDTGVHKKIRACLFDMDGLLINSEEIYTEVTNQILAEHGKGQLPWEVKIELQGRPGPDVSQLQSFEVLDNGC